MSPPYQPHEGMGGGGTDEGSRKATRLNAKMAFRVMGLYAHPRLYEIVTLPTYALFLRGLRCRAWK
jgi:hypothetical protein